MCTWACLCGRVRHAVTGFLATFGWEMFGPSSHSKARGVFGLFAVAVTLNMFLFPLLTSSISGNALSIAQSDAISEAGNFLGPLDQVFQVQPLSMRTLCVLCLTRVSYPQPLSSLRTEPPCASRPP